MNTITSLDAGIRAGSVPGRMLPKLAMNLRCGPTFRSELACGTEPEHQRVGFDG
jgi:hypothetical protein